MTTPTTEQAQQSNTNTQATPEAGAEFRSMSPEQFAARLKAEREAGQRAALGVLGVDSLDVAKARLEAQKQAELATLTEQQRLAKQLEELAPVAARAKAYEQTIAQTLASEESAIPEGKRGLLALAPIEPADRLAWLSKAKAAGLFSGGAAAGAVAPVTTRAGGTAPSPQQPTGPKPVKDMSPEEYRAWWDAKVATERGRG